MSAAGPSHGFMGSQGDRAAGGHTPRVARPQGAELHGAAGGGSELA